MEKLRQSALSPQCFRSRSHLPEQAERCVRELSLQAAVLLFAHHLGIRLLRAFDPHLVNLHEIINTQVKRQSSIGSCCKPLDSAMDDLAPMCRQSKLKLDETCRRRLEGVPGIGVASKAVDGITFSTHRVRIDVTVAIIAVQIIVRRILERYDFSNPEGHAEVDCGG